MKRPSWIGVLTLILTAAWNASAQTPLGTAFTYQGKLNDDGGGVNAVVDMRFSLWDASANGNQIGSTLRFDGTGGNGQPISLTSGLFTVSLDFGTAAFAANNARWLKIEVRNPHDPADAAPYVALTPRQSITATPAATFSQNTRGLSVGATGNVGIAGSTNPGFPLTFGDVLGDKVSLWGQAGDHYGLGIQPGLLQIHGCCNSSDIAFGYGRSAAMTEVMRIKGNGNVGIGTNNPANKLTVAGAIQSTTGGFVFPDGTTQTTTLSPFPGDLMVGGHINGSAGVSVATRTAGHSITWSNAPANFVQLPDSNATADLPAGVAVINWTASAWTNTAPCRMEIKPVINGVEGHVVPLYFNISSEHLSVSGSDVINVPSAGTATIQLLYRTLNGSQVNMDVNDSVSWTVVVHRS